MNRREYRPVPGTGRCFYCHEVDNADHIPHPWWQILGWLWRSHWIWQLYTGLGAMIVLTLFIAAARTFIAHH